jgi:uncharacterized damage-inducible protein DinB
MSRYDFLTESYRTERLKTLSVWSQVPDTRMTFRPEPRARTPHEHMVHQCVSEDAWMRNMLGIMLSRAALPADEGRLTFIEHYAAVSAERLAQLESKPDAWFEEETGFFDVRRSRAWVLTRRLTHSAHHRGQLTVYLRLWGQSLYSTYGPTADTGGLLQNQAQVVYRYASIDELIERERAGGDMPPLPGPGEKSPTERPGTG